MRLPDIWTGLGFACLGGFVVLRATTFPEPAGAAGMTTAACSGPWPKTGCGRQGGWSGFF